MKLIMFLAGISVMYTVTHFLLACFGEIIAILATLGIAHLIIKTAGIDL